MDLPNLPRVLKKREASLTPKFHKLIHKEWEKRGRSYAVEFKVGSNKLAVHQKRDLLRVNEGSFKMKLSDATLGKQPFDGFGLVNADALVARIDPDTKSCQVEVLNTGEILVYN